MKKVYPAFVVFGLLMIGSNLFGDAYDDKITVYKGKDDAVFDGGSLCKGSGHKCMEVTAAELAGLIKFVKTLEKE